MLKCRFAPSPTGYLHVGGARTALFNWLLARHAGGTFVLRIEDTDRARSSEAMTRAILDGMRWLGLDWDEGPTHQADGVQRHRRDALRLLETGKAYRCFCSPEELEERRRDAAGDEGYRYDRRCLLGVPREEGDRRAAAGQSYTVRFEVPDGTTAWDDAVHDRLEFRNEDIEDFIILRSDGTPIYNLAVVSDDVEMGITHVLRGDDHISNTPKQILLYRALGHEIPVFGHVPMILGPDGKRLSKRHGATALGEYEEAGILPAAMFNFLALLGWSPGGDREVMEVDEIVRLFSLDGINRKSAIFDTEKLEWLNSQHLRSLPAAALESAVAERLIAAGLTTAAALDARPEWLRSLLDLLKPRARTLADFVAQARPFLAEVSDYEEQAARKHWKRPAEVRERMAALRDRYAELDAWREEPLEEALRGLAEAMEVGAGKLIHPLRLAVTGSGASPGIFEVLVLLGRDRALERIDRALDALAERASQVEAGREAE